MDAPERIWAGRWPHGGRAWRETPEQFHITTEYVRADLIEAQAAQLQEARERIKELADAARSACDARLHQPLIEALWDADAFLAKSQ